MKVEDKERVDIKNIYEMLYDFRSVNTLCEIVKSSYYNRKY
jgi:hypothetical protein